MKNMVPHFTIAALALVGLIWKGVWGFVIGLVGGYVAVVIFGLVLTAASGGLLPKKVRKETARNFCTENADQLLELIPPGHEGKEAEFIERLLERIFHKAAIIGPSTSSGMSFGEVDAAVQIIKEEVDDPRERETIDVLWDFVQREWYHAL